jgi:CheY-like chemotaxis protein
LRFRSASFQCGNVGEQIAPKIGAATLVTRLLGAFVRVPCILIVDDEENLRRTLALGLKVEGFDTLQASSGVEAIEILGRGEEVDLVLVDLMMPGLNGLEVARHVTRSFPHVQVVLSSAYHLSRSQLVRSNCGAIGFVPKPYSMSELARYLRDKTLPPSARAVKRAV